MDFAEFIRMHDGDDLGALALSRGRYATQVDDFDLALTTLEVRRKLHAKVPEWYALPALHYPLRLSGEQCSSSVTAFYKAHVAMAEGATSAVADLTGGLGVDSWAFAQLFDQVLYNEMRPELAAAARHNFAALGLRNVSFSCAEINPSSVAAVLGDFRPDILYLDPARRAEDGRKVFRLEDCRPDVLRLLPELLEACPRVLLKLSPMADISLVCQQLGCVRQVHVVASEGECKELLLLLEKGYEGEHRLFVMEDGAVQEMPVRSDSGDVHPVRMLSSGAWLFEPGKALLKAGAFDWPCRFGLAKLGRHTHLYVGPEVVEALHPFGKWFRIVEVLPLDKRSFRELGARYPRSSVTARNIPLSSEELRRKLSVSDGGDTHIFGVHVDGEDANVLIVCADKNLRTRR